jgi:SAM-dependent methyltransferase
MYSETLHTIETALANLPGVLRAAVVVQEPRSAEPELIAYIVPDDEYMERTFSSYNDEAQRTDQWRKIYDLYQKPTLGRFMETGFSSRVWQSVYTKRPIPDHEMQEWIGCALDQITQLRPTKILDIGCGLGALLLPLGPNCERYVGTDISGRSIAALKDRVGDFAGKWRSITLLERPADNFDDFVAGSFDTVIINSVCMYFPSVEYLTKVLMGAIRMVRPNGQIFVGDIRSLPLLPNFAVSVEMFQAPSGLSLDELRLRVHKRLKLEKQLLISPSYFLALQELNTDIAHVEIRPKRGIYDNEMNRFRYDVVLRLGSFTKTPTEPSWLDWVENDLSIQSLNETLRNQQPGMLGITGIGNGRIEKDNIALEILSRNDQSPSVGELREALNNVATHGVHLERLFSLADKLGYQLDCSWASCRPDGRYDVLFHRADIKSSRCIFNWPRPKLVNCQLAQQVADPIRMDHFRKLAQNLRESLRSKLGERFVPVDFVVLHAMPKTSVGSIDRNALPLPWLSRL